MHNLNMDDSHASHYTSPYPAAPDAVFGHMDLPGTSLHYVSSGSGPPLIMVPATVSLIQQWKPLVQFMGLRFSASFFELPGHGGSSPYPQSFHSSLVPKTVEDFADRLGLDRFNLMGFSFGGLLAMRTLESLQHRIDKVILLSPLLSCRTVLFSGRQQWVMRRLVRLLSIPNTRQTAARLMHLDALQPVLAQALSRLSNIDRKIIENKDALNISETTLDVLAHTMGEILEMDYRPPSPFTTPCYFAMSVNDDLIDYTLTEPIVRESFPQLKIQQFDYPYHQPPDPPTFEWLVDRFYPFLELLDQ